MQLHEELAQRIVDRAKKIIKHPLNVMDESGIIIASTNAARKYQKHGGAILALSELKPIEISSSMLADFPNVKPGVNLPIIFNDQPIGVIGISGPPEEIRPLGEMVKMAAEMVVEYTSMMEMTRWSERKVEEFLLEWIEPDVDLEHISNLASQLKVNIERPLVIAMVEVANNDEHKRLNDAIVHWSRKRIKAEYAYRKTIILLHPTESEVQHREEIDDWKSLKQYLKQHLKQPFCCSIGEIYTQPKDLCFAFQSAVAVLKAGKRLKPEQPYYSYADFELPALFEGSFSSWQREKLMSYAEELERVDDSLISTLKSWFENNCDNKLTSAALYVHPNTLRYRLKRVEEICDLNLHHYQDICRLYFSIIL